MKLSRANVVRMSLLAGSLAWTIGMAAAAVAYDSPALALLSDGWNEEPVVTSQFETSFAPYSGQTRIVILTDHDQQPVNANRPLARFHQDPQPAGKKPIGRPVRKVAYASAADRSQDARPAVMLADEPHGATAAADGFVSPYSRPIAYMSAEAPIAPRDPQGSAPPLPPATATVEPVNPAPPVGSGSTPADPNRSPNAREPEKYGEKPVDDSRQFLRRQAVTLPAGQRQYDLGINYVLFEDDFPNIANNILIKSRVRQRLLVAPLAFRMGLTDRLQGFITAPVGWIGNEISSPGSSVSTSNGGIGDTNVGLSYWLKQSDGCCFTPDVITSFAVTAPTGDATFAQALLSNPVANLGQGFWALQWNVLFVQTYDPVTLFYGFGSRHRLERHFGNTSVAAGGQYNYQFGVGFAVNEHITLSTAFLGSYISDLYLDDIRIPGTVQEPLRLRFAVTMSKQCRIVEPYAEIGMTTDAPAASVGVTWTY